uniref:Uncharacterized protein n=1 Tax=Rhizophora mucronata TaxID=61149 RepID=A0A2P2PX28_RHIMU
MHSVYGIVTTGRLPYNCNCLVTNMIC